MDPGEIEFIAGSSSVSGDEDVLDLGRPRRGIPRWLQAVAVVAVVGAGVVTVTHNSGATRKPATVPTAGPSESDRAVAPTPGASTSVAGSHDPIFHVPAGVCSTSGCALSPDVPQDIVTALHDYVPKAAAPTVLTFVSDPSSGNEMIEQRTIESVFGSVDMLVRITRYRHSTNATPSAIKPTPPGLASAFLRVEGAAFVVDLEWIGPETQPPPIDSLNELIRDSRLEAPS